MKLLVKYGDPSQTNSPAEFEIDANSVVTIGRDDEQSIVFPTPTVSRAHARILRDPTNPLYLSLEDVGSSNGTYVNGKKITTPTRLEPGATVKLGQKGPEFTIDTDPKPPMGTTMEPIGTQFETPIPTAAGEQPIKRPTVQTTVPKPVAGSPVPWIAVAFAVVLVGIAVFLYVAKGKAGGPSSAGPVLASKPPASASNDTKGLVVGSQAIFTSFSPAIARVEVDWQYVDEATHLPLYFYKLRYKGRNYHVYVEVGSHIVPVPTTDASDPSALLGSWRSTGTGFLVSKDGYFLTCRHVVNPWKSSVTLHNISGVILVHHDGTWNVVEEPFDANYDVDDFNSKELRNLTTAWKIGRVDVDGAATKSFATVGDSTKRLNVISVTPSNERDVALAKLDSPTAFPTVDLAQGDTNPKEGSDITVLGFPANALSSEDVPIGGNTDSDTTRTYQVILGDGKIGAVSKPTEIKSHSMHESDFQDSYQLTMTSMGHGASGSPVFDTATGTVIGILAFGTVTPGDPMAIYAIPIKYGLKLLKP